jgi:hypothetical protein
VSAFEMPLETSEKLEFLSDIENSAEKLADLLDAFEALTPDAPGSTPSPGVPAPAAGASGGVPVAGHVR